MVMLMGLRGTPFLYYGDEIGMPDTEIPKDHVLDPVGIIFGAFGRDPERTPMHWTGDPGGGFGTPAGVAPWLPYGDAAACNVEAQRADPASMLSLTRDLVGLRDALPDLRTGEYRSLDTSGDHLWAWARGQGVVVACNLGDEPAELDGVHGEIRVSTDRSRDDERVDGTLSLAPWEAVIVWCQPSA
jgi:alpha-glucosidase